MIATLGKHPLDVRQLRYVDELVRQGSLRKAAAVLGVSPAVLSREIAQVEQVLGSRLFNRLPRATVPTAAGVELSIYARGVLAAKQAENRECVPASETLWVGCLDYGSGQAVQRAAIAEFEAQYPHAHVALSPTTIDAQERAVTRGLLQVGFYNGSPPTHPGVASSVMFSETVSCALLPLGHRLVDLPVLSLSDLSGIPLHTVRTDDAPEIMAGVHDALRNSGWRGRQTHGSAHPSDVMTMVACGAGWSPGPSALIGWAPAGIVARPVADGALVRYDMHLLWVEDNPLAAAFARLVLELRDVVEAVAAPRSSWTHGGHYETLLAQRHAERARIAGDLHDTLLQDIIGSHLQLEVLRRRLPDTLEEEDATLADVVKRLERAVREGRNLLQNLRPMRSRPRDLSIALASTGEELREGVPVDWTVSTEGAPRTLHSSVEEIAFRIGAEAISNAFRHASATRICAVIEYWDDRFRLRVVDDGIGIDPAMTRAGQALGHLGMVLMSERAQSVGGTLSLRSSPGRGTTVELVIPGHLAFTSAIG
jgi:signal transduction histidine kinase